MTTFQKTIKYLAIAFAIFIIVNIISGIFWGLYAFANILGLKKQENQLLGEVKEIVTETEIKEATNLKIELKYTNLTIKEGTTFKIESNRTDIMTNQNGKELSIKEKDNNWFSRDPKGELVLSIPENKIFNKIKIETGAGEIKIEKLQAEELSFEIGAGKVEIQDLRISQQAKIDGGAGKVEILAGQINDLDLDMGVGEFVLKTKLTGKNDIDAGIGKLDITLLDDIENYTIKASKGIGSIRLKEKEISNDVEYGTGKNLIKISGGIGAILIK